MTKVVYVREILISLKLCQVTVDLQIVDKKEDLVYF
jgi:hypothetical protein